MINWVVRSLEGVSRCIGRGFVGLDDVLSPSCKPGREKNGTDNSEQEFERIRESLWRLRRDLDELGASGFFQEVSGLLDEAFGGPEGFVRTVRAWANLIDALVTEAEHDFGRQPGRGTYKKRNVKGAMLYLVRNSDLDIPRVPAFIEPIVWNIFLDPVIDMIAHVSNRNDLWGDMPETPTLRGRANVAMQRVGSLWEGLAAWLTKLIWSIVFLASPVSPRLKAAVDEFLRENPRPMRTVLAIVSWVARNSGNLVILSDLLSVVVVEAQFVEQADEEGRKAYARDLMLAFIDQEVGLPDRNTFRFRLLVMLTEVGVEVVAMLFEKHKFFAPARTPQLRLGQPAVGARR